MLQLIGEQRYQTVLAVIADDLAVWQAADNQGVSRQTLHTWLAGYEPHGQGAIPSSG